MNVLVSQCTVAVAAGKAW